MNTELLITRYLQSDDDIKYIGELLYYTDPYIYPALFGSVDNARSIIAEAIRRDFYWFNKTTIFCAMNGEKPIGMLIVNNKKKWNSCEWRRIINDLKISLPATSNIVEQRYFIPMNKEEFNNKTYILAICVLPECRGKGIGKKLLREFIKSRNNTIVLDCLKDNKNAIGLYKHLGFKVSEYYEGFSTETPFPRCVRMEREIYNDEKNN